MKRIFLLIVCVSIVVGAMAQSKGFTKQGLTEVQLMAMTAKSSTSLALIKGSSELKSPIELKGLFVNVIDTLKQKPACFTSKDAICGIYDAFSDESSKTYKTKFVSSGNGIPIYTSYKDAKVLVLPPLSYLSTFNTLKLDDKQRAQSVIYDVLLSELYNIAASLPADMKYIGISICYGVKDFSDKYASGDGEYILMVSPISFVKDFLNANITDNELIEKSDVFISDADHFRILKKVKLQLK